MPARSPALAPRGRARGDEGFTLIEMLLALVILPLVMAAVAVAIFVTLADQSKVATRLSDSVDSQITATYFGRDVESAACLTTTQAPATPPWSSPATCGSGTASNFILGLAWADGATRPSCPTGARGAPPPPGAPRERP